MRILCLASRLPYPPDRGDRLRAFNFIKQLSHEHELSLVSFVADASEYEHQQALLTYCREVRVLLMHRYRSAMSVLLNLWRRDPLQTLYYRSGAMRRLVGEVLAENQFDVVYVHLFRMAPYVAGYPNLYRVVDLTDVISQEVVRSLPYRGLAWRLLYSLERPRIERYERYVAETFEETWLISDADRRVLAADCPAANIRVVANGVDLERFYPTGHPAEPNSLIFVGHLGVFHNVDAAVHLVRDVLPRVRRQIPGCTLTLAGAEPSAQVVRLGEVPGVRVTGFVPDLNEHLNRAAVFVAPLRFAAGVQNKVLEAMAAGRPVVTTSVVNAGLGAQPGEEVMVSDDVTATAAQVIALLRNAELQTRIGEAGRRFVRRKYDWGQVVRRMNEIERAQFGRAEAAR
jgi:sugar transferase (PEP-CTERM/EpsH1 system associated)